MSDRLAVMNRGRVEQLGPPRELYEEPETIFVADFLGIANLVPAIAEAREGDRCRLRVGEYTLHASRGHLDTRGATKLLVRPERVRLEAHGSPGGNRLPGLVERTVYRGNSNQVFVRLSGGEQIQVLTQNSGEATDFRGGDAVSVYMPPDSLRVLIDIDRSSRIQEEAGQEMEQTVGT